MAEFTITQRGARSLLYLLHAKSFRGEQFLVAEDGIGDDKLVIFATEDNLRRLTEADWAGLE